MPQTPITKPKLLLGEGKDEINFFNALLRHLNILDVQVDEHGGKSRVSAGLKALTNRTGFDQVISIGVTRDADYADGTEDHTVIAQRAFHSICGALEHANLSIPPAPMDKTAGHPNVSIFILPNNQHAGMLEEVCLASVQETEVACLNSYFDCIARETNRTQLQRNISKSRIHSWLATQFEPDKRLGEAALGGYFNWDHPAFDLLKQFLRQL